MDIGAMIEFDGKRNVLFFNERTYEYPIGGMIAEYARLHPTDIKPLIMRCPYLDDEITKEKAADLMMWFLGELIDVFEPVTANMVFTDFYNNIQDYMTASEEEKEMFIENCNKGIREDQIKQFILKDTPYTEFGLQNIGQMLLSAYSTYSLSYVSFKYSFMMLASEEKYEEDDVMKFWGLYKDNIELQHIDFKIMFMDSRFCSVYNIKSSMSLILFEAAHVFDNETKFAKCANCGEYFVLSGRSDAIYCSYPSPQDKEKPCNVIGAQITRAEKVRNDEATKEYRKVYGRYTTHLSRHPDDEDKKRKFDILRTEIKGWRNRLAHNQATMEEFFDWLNTF